jgi:hypothetical protein
VLCQEFSQIEAVAQDKIDNNQINMANGNPQQQAQRIQKDAESQSKAPKKLSYPTVIHPDLYQRANFTLQASTFLQQLQLDTPSSLDRKGKRKAFYDQGKHVRSDGDDSRKLARNMMAATGKMVVHNQMKLLVFFPS